MQSKEACGHDQHSAAINYSIVASVVVGIGVLIAFWAGSFALRKRKFLKNLHGKCVVITGCDSGIGRATLLKLIGHKNIQTIAIFFAKEEAVEFQKQYKFEWLTTIQCDLRNQEQIQSVARKIIKDKSEILYAVINIAGIIKAGDALIMKNSEFREVMEVNYFGTVQLTQAFLPVLIKNQGRVILTSSILAQLALPGLAAYTSSKLALEGYGECLRRETKLLGLKVVTIRPPQTQTKLLSDLWQSYNMSFESAAEKNRVMLGERYLEKVTNGKMRQVTELTSISPVNTANTIVSAIFALNPAATYWVGWFSKIVALPLTALPSAIVDFLLVRGNQFFFGIKASLPE